MSSIVFCQPTVIDHAYIDRFGRVIGGSFNPDFVATGDLRDGEEVVADFSFGKKLIKDLIDSKSVGYDHKLWIMVGESQCDIKITSLPVEETLELLDNNNKFQVYYKVEASARVTGDFEAVSEIYENMIFPCEADILYQYCKENTRVDKPIPMPLLNAPMPLREAHTVIIETPSTTLVLPLDAVKFIKGGYNEQDIAASMSEFLTKGFHAYHEHGKTCEISYDVPDIKIETVIRAEPHTFINPVKDTVELVSIFRYTHGLGRSTSWGCQNVAHGHKSYLQFIPKDNLSDMEIEDMQNLLEATASQLDNAVFINEKDVIQSSETKITVQYETRERGMFYAEYDRLEYHNIYVLDRETTVENIADHVYLFTQHDLEEAKVSKMLISEGLNKGCLITV